MLFLSYLSIWGQGKLYRASVLDFAGLLGNKGYGRRAAVKSTVGKAL